MTKSAGPFSVYGWLDRSFDNCWFIRINGAVTVETCFSAEKVAKTARRDYESSLVGWLKSKDGKAWLRANGLLKESPRPDEGGGQ